MTIAEKPSAAGRWRDRGPCDDRDGADVGNTAAAKANINGMMRFDLIAGPPCPTIAD
jgi:hypothetical protein